MAMIIDAGRNGRARTSEHSLVAIYESQLLVFSSHPFTNKRTV